MGNIELDTPEYTFEFSKRATEDLSKIQKSGTLSDKSKLKRIFGEMATSPAEGIGEPKLLKGEEGRVWSRRLNKKDRIVYEIFEEEKSILIYQLLGHYDDK